MKISQWRNCSCMLNHRNLNDFLVTFSLTLKSVILNFVACLVFLGMVFSTKHEAAIKKIRPPAMITAEYDAILSQWERAHFYNHLSNYTKVLYYQTLLPGISGLEDWETTPCVIISTLNKLSLSYPNYTKTIDTKLGSFWSVSKSVSSCTALKLSIYSAMYSSLSISSSSSMVS